MQVKQGLTCWFWVCDAPQFKEKVIVIAGGGDAGLTEALYLARIAAEINVIEELPELTASRILQERVLANSKINVRCGTKIEGIKGNGQVQELAIMNLLGNEKMKLEVGGVLVRIGLVPNTSYLKDLLSLSEDGFILVNEAMETSVSGIFAAGDIRYGSARQIATAVGDGVTAALSAGKLIGLKN